MCSNIVCWWCDYIYDPCDHEECPNCGEFNDIEEFNDLWYEEEFDDEY